MEYASYYYIAQSENNTESASSLRVCISEDHYQSVAILYTVYNYNQQNIHGAARYRRTDPPAGSGQPIRYYIPNLVDDDARDIRELQSKELLSFIRDMNTRSDKLFEVILKRFEQLDEKQRLHELMMARERDQQARERNQLEERLARERDQLEQRLARERNQLEEKLAREREQFEQRLAHDREIQIYMLYALYRLNGVPYQSFARPNYPVTQTFNLAPSQHLPIYHYSLTYSQYIMRR